METDNKHVIVGIGASAGGVEALQQFFSSVPSLSGMSFVVVQHLSPDYKSLMADILSKHSSEIAFYHIVVLNQCGDRRNILVRQLAGFESGVNFRFLEDFLGKRRTNSVKILDGVLNTLVGRDVDSDNSRHSCRAPFQPCFCL